MICRILADDTIKHRYKADISKFKEALIARFNTRTIINKIETENLVSKSVKQEKHEDICSYNTRTKGFLKEVGG